MVPEDIDRDGSLDILSLHWGSLSVLRNAGDGTYAPPVDVPGRSGMRVLRAADVTGDGFVDAVAARNQAIEVFENDGAAFMPSRSSSLPGDIKDFATIDFDQDGDLDLAASTCPDYDVCDLKLAENDGNGTFSHYATLRIAEGSHSQGPGSGAVRVADLDQDGFMDVIVVNRFRQELSVFRGQGAGGFTSEVRIPAGVSWPRYPVLFDFDHDGFLDVLVADGEGDVALLRNRGDGSFDPGQSYSTAGGNEALALLWWVGADAPSLVLINDALSLQGRSIIDPAPAEVP